MSHSHTISYVSTHKHNHHKHNLEYCEQCKIVYCTTCDKEWRENPTYTTVYPSQPASGTWINVIPYTFPVNTDIQFTWTGYVDTENMTSLIDKELEKKCKKIMKDNYAIRY